MKAAYFEEYGGPLTVSQVDDPAVDDDGVIIKVEASGICRRELHPLPPKARSPRPGRAARGR
jgi:D-arabinose 1-dehydrogenase-like Zn-dependent alcohol dehydrogenase